MTRSNAGFTLIELLIVVAIVGIISVIAMPAYTEHIARGARADAKAQLLMAAQYVQRFQASNDSYRVDRSGTSLKSILPSELQQSPSAGTALYKIDFDDTAAVLKDTEFVLVMKPVAGQRMANDQCMAFTMDNYGRRGVTADSSKLASCWK